MPRSVSSFVRRLPNTSPVNSKKSALMSSCRSSEEIAETLWPKRGMLKDTFSLAHTMMGRARECHPPAIMLRALL